MGFMTTFTVLNDGAENIKRNKEEFADIIYNSLNQVRPKEHGLGNHCNMIITQAPAHADHHKYYVQRQNMVIDVCAFGGDIKTLAESHPDLAESIVSDVEWNAKELRKQLEKIKKKSHDYTDDELDRLSANI